VAVDATVLDRSYRVVTTHLEPFAPPIQTAQAQELIAALDDETLPIILLGDMNSPAPGGGTYQLLLSEGFSDIWTRNKTPHAGAGFTCCQAANLRNPLSLLSARIDLILFRSSAEVGRELGAVFAAVVGEEPQDRTPSGLWPSDHAGVVATMRIPSSIVHNHEFGTTAPGP
jgi:endonuclease/exonuclease/phosphatase family metal-dependent hydrolase